MASPSAAVIRHRMRPLDMGGSAEALFPVTAARTDRVHLKARATVGPAQGSSLTLIDIIEQIDGRALGNPILAEPLSPQTWKITASRRHWLFGLMGRAYLEESGGRVVLGFDLFINPTRYLAHTFGDHRADVIENLRVRSDRRQSLQCNSLDGNDNYLTRDTLAVAGGGHSMWWRGVVTRCLHDVRQALGEAMCPPGAQVYSLTFDQPIAVETYWELSTSRAMPVIKCLGDELIGSDTLASVTRNPLGRGCAWISLALRQDIGLKIYAKTDDRVRFEITHDGRVPQVLGSSARELPLADRIIALRADAQLRLCAVWSSLLSFRQAAANTVEQHDALGLYLNAMARLSERHRQAFFDRIAMGVAITATGRDGPTPRSVCERLAEHGVLEFSGIRRRGSQFRPARRYIAIFRSLASALNGAQLSLAA